MNTEVKKYKYIDALRGLAILLVVLVHTSVLASPGLLGLIVPHGAKGVQLFFIVSALTLAMSFKQRILKQEKEIKLKFFIRRFFRIAPLFYLMILIYIVLQNFLDYSIFEHVDSISFSNIISHIFFINSFSPYWINTLVPGGWSIAVEFMFYVFFPLVFLKYIKLERVNKKNFLYDLFVYIFLIGFLFIKLITIFPLIDISDVNNFNLYNGFLFYGFPTQAFVFIIGLIIFDKIDNKEKIFIRKEVLAISICLLISLIFKSFFSMILISFLFGYFVLFLERYANQKKIFNILVNELTIFFGKISYSIYLIHFLLLFIIIKFDLFRFLFRISVSTEIRFILAYLLFLCSSTLISIMTYEVIEKPGIRLGKYIINKLK